MKLSRIIEVGFFMGVLLILGVIGETKVSLAQNACSDNRADKYRGQNGKQVTCVCPANFGLGNLWGSDVYTDDSDICTAAVHAGLITRQAGGTVTIEIRPGQASYRREARVSISGSETVTSSEYGAWHGSFVFVRSGTIIQPPQQQTNRPPNVPTLLSPPNTYQPSVGINPQQPYVQLTWQNNGDPDNDPLSFALDIRYWDAAAQVWKPLFNEYVQGTSFTLTPPRLAYNTYYSWGVVAVESGKSNPQRTPTNWSYFLTGPQAFGY
jgi:hypothetical protein